MYDILNILKGLKGPVLFSKPLLYQFKKNNNYPKGTREVLTTQKPPLSADDLHTV